MFLYRRVIDRQVGDLSEVIRARKPKRLPVVMTGDEVKAVLAAPEGRFVMPPTAIVPDDSSHNGDQHIFVSYSRDDETIVEPLVRLIRATGSSVFMDIDSIPPGKRWRPVIVQSLDRAAVVLVFWCQHSASSIHVQEEWQQALQLNKDTVPVLLDDTLVAPELAKYQWVDLRRFVDHPHSTDTESRDSVSDDVYESQSRILSYAGPLLLFALRERSQLQQDASVVACVNRAFGELRELWETYQAVSNLRRPLAAILHRLEFLDTQPTESATLRRKMQYEMQSCKMGCQALLTLLDNRDREAYADRSDPREKLFHFLKHRLVGQGEPDDKGTDRRRWYLNIGVAEEFVRRVDTVARESASGRIESILRITKGEVHGAKTGWVWDVCELAHTAEEVEIALGCYINGVLADLVDFLRHAQDYPSSDRKYLASICDNILRLLRVVVLRAQ